jgi:hypothetical protein
LQKKQLILGFFPVLGNVIEEEEPEETSADKTLDSSGVAQNAPKCEDDNDDYANADDKGSIVEESSCSNNNDDACSDSPPENTNQSLQLKELTTKLNKLITTITQSAAQQRKFDAVAKRLNLKVQPLIAGYGIQLNIKYHS